MKIYLDACAVIYTIEGNAPQQAATLQVLQQANPGGTLITSLLSRLECRVMPLRQNNAPLLAVYDAFFRQQSLEVSEISAAIIDQAAQLRATHGIKTPDAIHVATAMLRKADILVTGDKELAKISVIKTVLV